MGTPVIGSTVKLTGKVKDYCSLSGVCLVELKGNDHQTAGYVKVSMSEMANAEIVAEPLKVGDENLYHRSYPNQYRFKIMAMYEDNVVVRQFLQNDPIPIRDWVSKIENLYRK
jgi:hypothetical protein